MTALACSMPLIYGTQPGDVYFSTSDFRLDGRTQLCLLCAAAGRAHNHRV